MTYISSVAVVLTWSHDELTSNMADPLLYSAVIKLRRRMKDHLQSMDNFLSKDKWFRCDTMAACAVIELAKVSAGGKHHLKVAIASEIEHRARELSSQ